MTARRKRHGAVRWALAIWALLIVAAIGITVWRVIGWLAITAAISGAAYALGRSQSRARALTGKLGANARYGRLSAARGQRGVTDMDVVSAYPAGMRRERANGWVAPGRSVLLSAECAGSECVWCHDSRCQHDCGHLSREPQPVKVTRADKPPF